MLSTPAVRLPGRLRGAAAPATVSTPIGGLPDLPVIDWNSINVTAPAVTAVPNGSLPRADVVVITWTSAEWAALHHVFCASGTPTPYSARHPSSLPGWRRYTDHLPTDGHHSDWQFWGLYQEVTFAGRTILLFKSNTHLDWPGPSDLKTMIQLLIDTVQPDLIVSAGTAGGTRSDDHVGTVYIVDSAALYRKGRPPSEWPRCGSAWAASTAVLGGTAFSDLLPPVPTRPADLQTLVGQVNATHHTNLSLADLNPSDLNSGESVPAIRNDTPGGDPLLTTDTFVVGTTDGAYAGYTCSEMDDEVIAQACQASHVGYGSVRNLSDPAQNAELPTNLQSAWGNLIYTTYGLYTSFNGAMATAAALAAPPAAETTP